MREAWLPRGAAVTRQGNPDLAGQSRGQSEELVCMQTWLWQPYYNRGKVLALGHGLLGEP